jgi:hypothetical protein
MAANRLAKKSFGISPVHGRRTGVAMIAAPQTTSCYVLRHYLRTTKKIYYGQGRK